MRVGQWAGGPPGFAEIFVHRPSHDLLETLRIRLDRPGRLVEENPLHAEQRDEHRHQLDLRLLVARDLVDPVVERIEIDRPHRHARRRERAQHAEELLLRVDEIDDHAARSARSLRSFGAHSSRFALQFARHSISTPFPADGCRNATRQPCAPGTGASLISRYPAAFSRARCASMSSTRRQMWWIPSPRFSMNFAIGESGDGRLEQLEIRVADGEKRRLHPCVSTVSTCRCQPEVPRKSSPRRAT